MKAQSNVRPNGLFTVEKVDGVADIKFYENVVESIGTETVYEYDLYLLSTNYTEELESEIILNMQLWLNKAKDAEKKEIVVVPTMEEMAISLTETQLQLQVAQEALDFLIMGGM